MATPRADVAERRLIPHARVVGWTALGLLVFFGASAAVRYAGQGLGVGGFAPPPVYGQFRPGFSPIGVVALAVAAAVVALAWWVASRPVVRPAAVVAAAVVAMAAFSAAVPTVDGGGRAYTDPLEREQPAFLDYHGDTGLVARYGVRGFVERHPELVAGARSIHTRSHPPGPVLVVAALEHAFPTAVVLRALVLALLSTLVLVPAWFIARRMGGERAAVVAVLLLAVAPSPVLHAFVSLDALFAVLLAGGLALAVAGMGVEGSAARAAVAGAAIGATTFFTYGAAFVAVAAGLLALMVQPARAAARKVAAAAAGGVAVLAALRVAIGFDLLASYRASRDALFETPTSRRYWYWLLGSVAVWLAFAGVPAAALALRELVRSRPPLLIAVLAPLVLFYALPWRFTGIIPGETERTLLFAFPLAAAAAGTAFARWEGALPHPAAVATLVGLTAGQTIAFEAVYRTFW